ncbi:hypothetical protein GCM10009596_00690 [Arthrobacter rhombi]
MSRALLFDRTNVFLPWTTVMAFERISTDPRVVALGVTLAVPPTRTIGDPMVPRVTVEVMAAGTEPRTAKGVAVDGATGAATAATVPPRTSDEAVAMTAMARQSVVFIPPTFFPGPPRVRVMEIS